MRKVVGLDIPLKKIGVCVLDQDGQFVWQGKVDAEPGPLAERLRPWRDEIGLVGLEPVRSLNGCTATLLPTASSRSTRAISSSG